MCDVDMVDGCSQEAENEQAAWDPDWVQQYTRLFASRIRTSSRDPR